MPLWRANSRSGTIVQRNDPTSNGQVSIQLENLIRQSRQTTQILQNYDSVAR